MTITPGTWACVRLHDCPGDDHRPRNPTEDGMRVQVTATGERAGDHNVFALYQGGWSSAPKSPGGRGLGRYFRPDELEVIPETP